MFWIRGARNEASCYAETVEESALEQIQRMLSYDICDGSKVVIMPDVHAGTGCTIGTTMTVKDKIVPNVVGVDIGCGMYVVQINEEEVDLLKLDQVVHWIPSGMGVWKIDPEYKGERKTFKELTDGLDLKDLYCYDGLKNVERLELSLGTLGGGNHFIELEQGSRGRYFLVIHSGSRNLGLQVANYYQRRAIEECNGRGSDWKAQKDAVVEKLKSEGKEKYIQKELKKLREERKEKAIPDDLCYVSGKLMEEYLHDLDICQKFAVKNRERMAQIIVREMGWTVRNAFHTIHNYVDMENMILRKGAISAKRHELLLIPLNMRDGSILGFGKGNPDWNYSAPHGAGRIMGRNEARRNLSLEDYMREMNGIYSTSVGIETIDEAPMAYKDCQEIIRAIVDSVEIADILKPVYNYKSADSFSERSESGGLCELANEAYGESVSSEENETCGDSTNVAKRTPDFLVKELHVK